MTTFSRRNQSRVRYYRVLGTILIIAFVIALILKFPNFLSNKRTVKIDKLGLSNIDSTFYKNIPVECEIKVQAKTFLIKGQAQKVSNKYVASFLSVPYAEPPVETRRFQSPQTILEEKTIDAFHQPSRCIQSQYLTSISEINFYSKEKKEDCLYLNIWSPLKSCEKTGNSSYPVLIYIHSGLFQFGGIGTPDLEPSKLVAENNIVVVTIQYRLGIFGFSSSNIISTESLGLQDQAKALQWVNGNIRFFNGDPQRITLVGHGAGAISIGFHLMNSNINTLFKRVIIQGVHNIWNIGLYGVNKQSIKYLINDFDCEENFIQKNDLDKCIEAHKHDASTLLENQQYLVDTFPVPFGPESSSLTEDAIEKIEKLPSNTKFNDSMLEKIFFRWNIYSPNHEILIGLNSDDDDQLETINKANIKVNFGDENVDEEKPDDTESNNLQVSTEKIEINLKTENMEETRENTKSMENNSTESDKSAFDEMVTTNSNFDVDIENFNISSKNMPIQRRKRKASFELDNEEIIKLCRLVKMFQFQMKKNQKNVLSQKVFFYRIEPKNLINLLEEVSLAFGSKQNWLKELDKKTMSLWASFIESGVVGVQKSDPILSDYDAGLISTSKTVNLIDIGQSITNENLSHLRILKLDKKMLCS